MGVIFWPWIKSQVKPIDSKSRSRQPHLFSSSSEMVQSFTADPGPERFNLVIRGSAHKGPQWGVGGSMRRWAGHNHKSVASKVWETCHRFCATIKVLPESISVFSHPLQFRSIGKNELKGWVKAALSCWGRFKEISFKGAFLQSTDKITKNIRFGTQTIQEVSVGGITFVFDCVWIKSLLSKIWCHGWVNWKKTDQHSLENKVWNKHEEKKRKESLSFQRHLHFSFSETKFNTDVIRLLSFTVTSTAAQIIGTCSIHSGLLEQFHKIYNLNTKYNIWYSWSIHKMMDGIEILEWDERDYGTLFSSLVKLFLVDFHRVSLREHLITNFTLEWSLLCVTAPVDIALSCSPEALATLEAGEGLWSTVHPLMDCLLASLPKTLGTESTLERLRVAMHPTVPLKTAATTQDLSNYWVVQMKFEMPLNLVLISDLIAHTTFEHFSCLPLCRLLLEPISKYVQHVPAPTHCSYERKRCSWTWSAHCCPVCATILAGRVLSWIRIWEKFFGLSSSHLGLPGFRFSNIGDSFFGDLFGDSAFKDILVSAA